MRKRCRDQAHRWAGRAVTNNRCRNNGKRSQPSRPSREDVMVHAFPAYVSLGLILSTALVVAAARFLARARANRRSTPRAEIDGASAARKRHDQKVARIGRDLA